MNEKELEIAENIKGMLSKNLRIPEEELDYVIASHTKRAVPKGNFGAALCILKRR